MHQQHRHAWPGLVIKRLYAISNFKDFGFHAPDKSSGGSSTYFLQQLQC